MPPALLARNGRKKLPTTRVWAKYLFFSLAMVLLFSYHSPEVAVDPYG